MIKVGVPPSFREEGSVKNEKTASVSQRFKQRYSVLVFYTSLPVSQHEAGRRIDPSSQLVIQHI